MSSPIASRLRERAASYEKLERIQEKLNLVVIKQSSKRLEKTVEPLLNSRIYQSNIEFVRVHDASSSESGSATVSMQSNQENRLP